MHMHSFMDMLAQFSREVDRNFMRSYRFLVRHRSAILVWVLGAGFAASGGVALWAATLRIPDLSSIQNRKVEQSVKIYDRTGEVLLYDLNRNVQRTIVPLAEISPNIQYAIIAIEDPAFFSHSGFKPTAFMRALFVNITSLGYSQGGSTITQQVVKSSILTGKKTIARKFEEIVLALKLERVLTKDQILELYLNQVPFGGSIYGAQEASRQFFGKHAADVTLGEAAYLAAVLPAPTYYSPYGNHTEDLDGRKNLVLDKMYEHGYITQTQRDEAKAEQVVFQKQRASAIAAPHFVFYVRQYLENKYGEDAIESNGWKIITSLDADLQAKAEEIVRAHALKNAESWNASNMGLSAIDPKTGQILVMVGSRYYFDTEIPGAYNITLAKRQPGSAFKPFAYAQAFADGFTPSTVVFDVPTQFSTACSPYDFTSDGECYSPKNYDNKFRGPMTLRNALAQSINIPSVETLYLAGINDTLRLAKSMGITTLGESGRYGLTLVLGGGEVTLLEMTSAYGAFAQNGTRYQPTPVLRIEDAAGNIIEDNSAPIGDRVLDPAIAEQINDVLSDTVAAAPLGLNSYRNFGRDVALKTGTTDDYHDAWILGYTPNFVAGAWAGNNDNTAMERRTGGLIVAPAWSEFMQYALTKIPVEHFSRSDTGTFTSKPVLNGIWQGGDIVTDPVTGMAAVVCDVHNILYWVDRSDPRGPSPRGASGDSQYRYWEAAAQTWAAHSGCAPGSLVPLYQPQPTATEITLPQSGIPQP